MPTTGLHGACPQCGGPLHFGGATSLVSICPHCRSAIARSDVGLETLGQAPDLVATDTRLSIGAMGSVEGHGFTVLGRTRLSEGRANWDEWYVVWADGSYGWLAEAQGRLIITRRVEPQAFGKLPEFDTLEAGAREHVGGLGELAIEQAGEATLVAAQGELPFAPQFGATYRFADATVAGGGYVTLDYGSEGDEIEVFFGRQLSYTDANLPAPLPSTSGATARGEALECPHCGAPLSLKQADTKSVVCPSCRALCDVRDGKLALITVMRNRAERREQSRLSPALPLGARGRLFGEELEVLGWLLRGCTVEGVDYRWNEYLLHGKGGYRWLSESDGHWMFLKPLAAAELRVHGDRVYVDGRFYKHFQRSHSVRYEAIQGEFYWNVRKGTRVDTDDYVAPPYILSREVEQQEQIWSQGQYVEADQVWSGFGQPESPPEQRGVSPCQPNPHRPRVRRYGTIAALSISLLVIVSVLLAIALPHTNVHSVVVPVRGDSQISLSEFDITRGTHAVEIEARAASPLRELLPEFPADPWVGLDVSLIDDTTGRAETIGLELWEDAGGSERQHVATTKLGPIEPGHYVLRVEAATLPGAQGQGEVRVTVWHGVFLWFPMFATLCLLLIPAALVTVLSLAFERKRWANSDYAPDE